MLKYPHIDPIAVSFGPLKVHWYGLMYMIGFVGGWWLGRMRARRPGSGWTPEAVGDLLFYVALGVVIGGRLGYVLFYTVLTPTEADVRIWEVWKGGMSFHGGLLGVMAAMWLYGRRYGKRFFEVADFVAPLVPIGLGAGRIGNFINAELWGKVSFLPWAMIFPDPRAGAVPRHPTPLYEFLLEGVVLFTVLWIFSHRPRPTMAVSGLFLLLYGLFRFLVEFVREPDAHIGYLAFGWFSMGQALSLPMVVAGAALLGWAYRRKSAPIGVDRL